MLWVSFPRKQTLIVLYVEFILRNDLKINIYGGMIKNNWAEEELSCDKVTTKTSATLAGNPDTG